MLHNKSLGNETESLNPTAKENTNPNPKTFWWLNPARLYSLYRLLYPKRRIESYSILGTVVSPQKILLLRQAEGESPPHEDLIRVSFRAYA